MMRGTRRLGAIAVATALAGAAFALPASALASDASIVSAIERYAPKITTVEGNVLRAVGKYESTGKDAGRVKAAIGRSMHVLGALRRDVARQSAPAGRVRRGRTKVEQGLRGIVGSYRRLRSEFGKPVSPEVAEADAKHLVHEVLAARRDLQKGLKLLLGG